MARIGILSDIHGNLEAFVEAVRFLERQGVDRVLCAGDIVGFNPWPNECVELAARIGVGAIAGNHDLIAIRRLGTERCADVAAFALLRTRRDLRPKAARYLAGLPARRVEQESRILLFHGTYADPTEYLRTPSRARATADAIRADHPTIRVAFFGHTHTPTVLAVEGDSVVRIACDDAVVLDPERMYLVNPGSVDASRKERGDRRAELAIFDERSRTLEMFAIPYDDERVERAAQAAGYRMGRSDGWASQARRLMRRGRRRLGAAARAIGVGRRDEQE